MLEGLPPTPGEPLPFADRIHIRAFRLDPLDVVIYAAPGVTGPARAQYLNHWHEASFGRGFAEAPLHIHEADAPWVDVPVTTFSDGDAFGEVQSIPIPGHTPGSTAFLWNGYLFTGDSLWLDGEDWIAAVLGDSDRAAYIESLERLRAVEFDHLVPWGASAGGLWHAPADKAKLDAVIERLRRGEDR
ncbi:metallo-beta-lactamase superfamily protein [Solirubrobacter pauli]|uniref:Metallo-beta-lactamase superfamily protein n=1 Tax=Solirubrobacter pauli TaxID=166793 RepID=A0A660LBW6_9ACTN|nr:MBL fold metallo-hydrolase [Solirubrobacter pauli]RKQ91725.1 metallo-beta-lactamase superfamily protein [Solirubrobacter pauli]